MSDGKLTGTTTDIVEGLKNALGVTVEIEMVPAARATEYAEKNQNVLVFTYAKTPERERAGFHFIGPVITRAHTLWKKKTTAISVKTFADVKSQNLTVGGTIGDFRSKLVKDAGVNVEEVATAELNLKKLMADRMPLMISSDFEMPALAKVAGVDIADLEPAFTFLEASSYLMFSRDVDPATLNKWQNAYASLQKTDFFTKVADKWSPVVGSPLKFAPEKGLYIH